MRFSRFNETILNLFQNFVPNKTITGNDKDLVWMNEKPRSKIKSGNELYKINIKIVKMNMIFQITERNELV